MTLTAGILLVDKPAGVTSHDVVDWIRFVTRMPTGHAGTLDPAATGLLVVLLGAATKLSELFAAEDKTYLARFRLGVRTRSDDLDGELLEQVAVDDEARRLGLVALAGLRGEHVLSPPAVSAVHVDGVRAHVRARRGESVEVPVRPMSVWAVDDPCLTREGDLEATLRVSKGTYVRSLAVELGRRVGLPCALSGLRRTQSGRFSLEGELPVLTGLHVEARQRPDGVSSVRIRLVDPSGGASASAALASPASAALVPDHGRPAIASESEPRRDSRGQAGNGASSHPHTASVVPVLSREASRAQIAERVLPLVSIAPFPCVHADDDVSLAWLRRLSMGQRLSAHEPGLCARFSRAEPTERPAQAGPGDVPAAIEAPRVDGVDAEPPEGAPAEVRGAAETARTPEYVAIYGTLDEGPPATPSGGPSPETATNCEPAGPPGRRESVLVLCVWSPSGDRLEPKRTIRGPIP